MTADFNLIHLISMHYGGYKMLNTVLYVVYLSILSLLPAHIAARSFRFAFFPAMQISLGNQKASQQVKVWMVCVFCAVASLMIAILA